MAAINQSTPPMATEQKQGTYKQPLLCWTNKIQSDQLPSSSLESIKASNREKSVCKKCMTSALEIARLMAVKFLMSTLNGSKCSTCMSSTLPQISGSGSLVGCMRYLSSPGASAEPGIWLGVRDEKRRRLTFTAYQTCMGLWLLEELSCKELNRLCMPGLAACNKDRFPD
eukprot:1137379-Pelagomonas_calceolata.AAC.7